MKTSLLAVIVLFAFGLMGSNAQAWVNNVHVLQGLVRNFDQKAVQLELADGSLVTVDRAVVNDRVILKPGKRIFIPLTLEQETSVRVVKSAKKPSGTRKPRFPALNYGSFQHSALRSDN